MFTVMAHSARTFATAANAFHPSNFKAVVAVIASLVVFQQAPAAMITLSTPAGATGKGGVLPVDAQATFTTSNDTVNIVLTNLQTDIQTLTQAINGLSFTISSGQHSGSLTSSSGESRTVKANGTFVNNGSVSTGWLLGTSGSTFTLSQIGSPAAPTHLIIGPASGSTYPDAGPSIAGAKQFNPFIADSATFVLHVPGVNSDSTINSASFNFGYTNCFSTTVAIPEPSTIILGLFGAASLALIAIKRRVKTAK